MNRLRTWRSLLLVVALLALLCGLTLWLDAAANHHEELNSDLLIAAQIGNVTDVQTLLTQGADPNTRDTPTQPAVSLLAYLKRLFAPDKPASQHGRTVLSLASQSRHPYAILKLLIDKGADVKASDKEDEPALFWAARSGDYQAVKLLVERGADVNVTTVGFTPLRGAILAEKPEIVKWLIAHGARIGAGDAAFAAQLGLKDMTALLEKTAPKK